jgi:DNA-binding transcriptional MocR family regulator
MTMWEPHLADRSGPLYRSIADALAEALEQGELAPGDRLPTHRALARRLGVTVGTVSRAYAEAERRGLVTGQVGRGTFVHPPAEESRVFGEPLSEGVEVDLRLSLAAVPCCPEEGRRLRESVRALGELELPRLMGPTPPGGTMAHRTAAARWLHDRGLRVEAEQVVVCSGAQHAMAAVFSTLAGPGDLVLCEELTFPGMKGVANLLRLRLEGIASDDAGLRPDALAVACRDRKVSALYTIPTLQNPTGTVMPEGRRREVAAVAAEHGVPVVEDDVYAFLLEDPPPPLFSLGPGESYYLTSTSKVVAAGLRIGFLAGPEERVERLTSAVWATAWMATPATAELVRRWIEEGAMKAFARWKREEAAARWEVARRVLGPHFPAGGPGAGFNLWLQLPEPWRAAELVAQARCRGVAITAAEEFVPGRGIAPHAVRLCLMAPRDRETLERGLGVIAGLLDAPPPPSIGVA